MSLLIGVPREVFPGEKRVATVPDVVEKLIKHGFRVAVEAGAGDAAQIADDAYRAAGAEIVADRAELWAKSDIVFKVRGPDNDEVALLREGGMLVSFIWPAQNPDLLKALAARNATVLAMDSVPPSRSRPSSCCIGARTLNTMSDVAQSCARSAMTSAPLAR
jgi:NAD(P) transhydrogenase subunit alpha